MKFIIVIAAFFTASNSFAQKVTHKDLIGHNFIDTTYGGGVHAVGLFIVDSTNFTMIGENYFRKFQYTLNEKMQTINVFKSSRYNYNKKEFEYQEYVEVIKIIDSNTLQRTLITETKEKNIKLLHRTN